MKTTAKSSRRRGYVSVLLVLSTGTILSLLTVFAYRRAINAQTFQSQVQLRVDYSEKEEAILRSVVSVVPNRAMRAMQAGSNLNDTSRNPLRWQDIFTEAMVMANSRTSISPALAAQMNITGLKTGNSGDSALNNPAEIFRAIGTENGYVSVGNNRNLGAGYPPPLSVSDTTVQSRDLLYPIISDKKTYGNLAQSGLGLPVATYNNYNLLKYPQINFGYIRPGDNFVAKRNWWAFSVDVGDGDDDRTFLARNKRNFVLSIYEIPSQLAISSASFTLLGQYASGASWENVNIDGGVFAGRADVKGTLPFDTVASRRSISIASGTKIGSKPLPNNPFAVGEREEYQATNGLFFPVSLASDSGRAVFIPINRGAAFFDRYSSTENDPFETTGARNHVAANTLSNQSWNNYSIGAQQCAMRLDITRVRSATDRTPTELRFEYMRTNGTRGVDTIPMTVANSSGTLTTLPPGYIRVCAENQSYNFSTPVDVAYGESGGYTFRRGVSGNIGFNNTNFGDPLVGTVKSGYYRPPSPFSTPVIDNGQLCISVNPERFPAYLASLNDNAAPVGPATVSGPFGYQGQGVAPYYNNSISVNVDYRNVGATYPTKPNIPCTDLDYGVVLKDSANLTAYTRGFSLVTNLRLYYGDDFNKIPTTPPTGYTPAVTAANPTGRYMPPCSLFAPEKRYGSESNVFAVNVGGSIGSLSRMDKVNAGDADAAVVRPLDSKNIHGTAINNENITVNLSQMRHPAELPPISMMNWLVLLEERRKEYY